VGVLSDLEMLRDHAREMATSEHNATCSTKRPFGMFRFCADTADHPSHHWDVWPGHDRRCPGRCSGCMTDAERKLWRQIADEVGAYLDQPDDEQETLL
jgi:hypothetical protein